MLVLVLETGGAAKMPSLCKMAKYRNPTPGTGSSACYFVFASSGGRQLVVAAKSGLIVL